MPARSRAAGGRLTRADYEALASLRRALRRFLAFSAAAAQAAGLTPQQHQALLAVKGFAGHSRASVGELAENLRVRHHSAVGLIDRLARRGLVRRTMDRQDRRRVQVRLTARGETVLARLSHAHRAELRLVGPELRRALERVIS